MLFPIAKYLPVSPVLLELEECWSLFYIIKLGLHIIVLWTISSSETVEDDLSIIFILLW